MTLTFHRLNGTDVIAAEKRKEIASARHVLVIVDDEFDRIGKDPRSLIHKLATAALGSPLINRVLATGFNILQLNELRQELDDSHDRDHVCYVVDIYAGAWDYRSRDGAEVVALLRKSQSGGGWGVPGERIALFSVGQEDALRTDWGLRCTIPKPEVFGELIGSRDDAYRIVEDAVRRFVESCFRSVQLLEDPTSAEDVLNVCGVLLKSVPVFVIGSFNKKVTIYSQQVRALTLVKALYDDGRIDDKSSIGIVGGGFAGVTAAVACRLVGAEVTLFETREALLWRQRGAPHRYVHPHIYDWPSRGSTQDFAGLPILDWLAAPADDVVKQVMEQFGRFEKGADGEMLIDVQTLQTVEDIKISDGKVAVRTSKGHGYDKVFKVVLSAIGYGLDEKPEFQSWSYWQDDGLANTQVADREILISGNGDGGLIDLARCCLNDFRVNDKNDSQEQRYGFSHGSVVENILRVEGMEHAGRLIDEADKDKEANKLTGDERGYDRYTLYQTRLAHLTESLKVAIKKRLDTHVTFVVEDSDVFRTDTAVINRLLAFLIIETDVVDRFYRGHLDEANLKVKNETGRDVASVGDCKKFLLRFGPNSEKHLEKQPPMIQECLQWHATHRTPQLEIGSVLDRKTFDFFFEKST